MFSPTDHPERPETLEDLRRVIRRIERREPFRVTPEPAERVLGGELVETGEGPLLVVRRSYPLSHRHGRMALGTALDAPDRALRVIARSQYLPDTRRLLFLDAETTGLAGGTGTYAFLVGVGYIEEDRFVVVQHFMRDLDAEPALLAALAPLLARASAIVTFNGSGFDVPLLETRFVLARRRWPGTLPHLDLLRPARRIWSTRFADCRLATLEREVLGHARGEDVPGSRIPSLYFDFLRRRHAVPLVPVFAHNRHDVLSLAALLGWFGCALDGDDRQLDARDLAGVGRLWEDVDPERSAEYYRAALAGGLSDEDGPGVRLRLATWEKRRQRWEQACALWRAVADATVFDARPWEELAKYQEHRQRDAQAARHIVTTALGLARASAASPRTLTALVHRLDRLERRLARTSRRVRSMARG